MCEVPRVQALPIRGDKAASQNLPPHQAGTHVLISMLEAFFPHYFALSFSVSLSLPLFLSLSLCSPPPPLPLSPPLRRPPSPSFDLDCPRVSLTLFVSVLLCVPCHFPVGMWVYVALLCVGVDTETTVSFRRA